MAFTNHQPYVDAVRVKTKITMPQWNGYDSASQAEKGEWDRFCAALRAHEQGHVDLIVKHFADIDERLVGKIGRRGQTTQGAVLGKKVAHYLKKHYFQPVQ